jgi:hypothetical protein
MAQGQSNGLIYFIITSIFFIPPELGRSRRKTSSVFRPSYLRNIYKAELQPFQPRRDKEEPVCLICSLAIPNAWLKAGQIG